MSNNTINTKIIMEGREEKIKVEIELSNNVHVLYTELIQS
jgi:hypothetical protein